MRILGISGACGATRGTRRSCGRQADELPPGAELVLHEGLKAIPPFDEDDEHDPHGAVHALRRAVAAADALVIATPEYNHSMPGQLKNALDWLSRPMATSPLRGKPVAVVGASTGLFGAVWAQAETRKVLTATGAVPLDRELPVGQAAGAFDLDGRLSDTDLAAELGSILSQLVTAAGERELAAA
jgi:chromate reductase